MFPTKNIIMQAYILFVVHQFHQPGIAPPMYPHRSKLEIKTKMSRILVIKTPLERYKFMPASDKSLACLIPDLIPKDMYLVDHN